MNFAPGTRLGDFEIVSLLGAGGMGEVYHAKDLRLGRDVALKVLPPDLAAHPERLARFELEARTVASLNHPNIVTLYSVEEQGGTRFLTMEFVEGVGLDAEVKPGGLPLARLLDLGVTLADALAAAHAKGVVHRDIKPANVMLTGDGRLKVLDFGLAKLATSNSDPDVDLTQAVTTATPLSSAGQVLGTIPYMAPEQLRGEPVDARSDLFALGVVLYELAAGQRPFVGATMGLVSAAILRDAPEPLSRLRADLPAALAQIILRCLEKSPGDRIGSALELRDQLRGVKQAMDRGEAMASVPARPSAVASIAVLPFVNRSGDPEDEYFSDGLADELLTVLTKVRGVRVVARTSAFQFKGTSDDIATIGRKLNVASVLEGSVRKAGNRIRVSVQLVQVADSFHIWSETYDRLLDDIFAVQDDIARSVVQELRATLLHEATDSRTSGQVKAEVAQAVRGRGTHPEAHRLHLLGRHFIGLGTREGKARGFASLKEAVRLDPGFALAWCDLASSYADQANLGALPMAEGYGLAREAAQRALDIEPDLAEAHAALGWFRLIYDWDHRGVDSIRRAVELAPGNARVLHTAGVAERMLGRFGEALALYRRAVECDPLSSAAHHNLGNVLLAQGRYAEAEVELRMSLDLAPRKMVTRSLLAHALTKQSRFDEALAEASAEPDDSYRLWALVCLHHAAGRPEDADAALRELIAIGAEDSAYQIAEAYAERGQADEAFAWLDRAIEQRDGGLSELKSSLCFRELTHDPRWRAILVRLGID